MGVNMKLIAVRAIKGVRAGVCLAALVWLGASQGIEAGTNVWTTSGPEGSSISCLAIDPLSSTTLYAVGGGLFKSTDRGRSWDFIGPDGACPLVIDPLTPTTLYYPTSSGVAKSTDGGSTWRSLEIAPGLRLMGVTALAIDPQTPTTLYAGAWSKPYVDRQGEGVFKTTDGGETWARAGDLGRFNSPSGFINSLVIEPRTPTMVHAATNLGVCNSSDGGATWGCSASGLAYYHINSLRIDPRTPSTIYANSSYEVQISRDGGYHWSDLGTDATGAGVYILAIDPHTPTTLYGGIYAAGVVKSTDAGATWSSLNAGLTDLRVTDLVIDPANPAILHAATRSGVFTLEQVSNRPPAADAGPDQIAEATGPDGAMVTLDG